MKNFEIVSITHLGEQTFIATGQTTISLFARKRKTNITISTCNKAKTFIEKFINQGVLEEKLEKYISYVYESYTNDEYKNYLRDEEVKKCEIEQFAIYLLNKDQTTIIVNTGKRADEIEFLGYKHTDKKMPQYLQTVE